MTYVYEHTESLCESRALHNWFIFSSDAPHQGRSPEVQGLQNSTEHKEHATKPPTQPVPAFQNTASEGETLIKVSFMAGLILKVSPMREWMNLVLSLITWNDFFFFWELNEQTTLQRQTNVRHNRKSTVRKALLTMMLRSIVSTALSRNIFSPKAAKKQLCEQRKGRRGGKKKKTKWNHTTWASLHLVLMEWVTNNISKCHFTTAWPNFTVEHQNASKPSLNAN